MYFYTFPTEGPWALRRSFTVGIPAYYIRAYWRTTHSHTAVLHICIPTYNIEATGVPHSHIAILTDVHGDLMIYKLFNGVTVELASVVGAAVSRVAVM